MGAKIREKTKSEKKRNQKKNETKRQTSIYFARKVFVSNRRVSIP